MNAITLKWVGVGAPGSSLNYSDCVATDQCNKYKSSDSVLCPMFLGSFPGAVCYTPFLYIRLVYDKHEL